ncbi:peptidase domain-containing ABC transporter [Gluconacetobacter diazotrophicus]|uniref:Peptidase domain-containing ABC transporter n=1 Tax=Gluconacetobacter diazotrophicus TaxID=33996 RepID=A0A7W4NNC4_GLUDI|nr:peptidase domain-containing ABC transporter [Gluconacetobacter diazotrophicus]MBB2158383.1 peptidase domain-containing ABC transporter [Gluconacetobacter diazotrophicus]
MNWQGWTGFRRKTPSLLQVEKNECGITCLAMILAYFDRKISISSMRRSARLDERGTTLNDLLAVARDHGLMPRAVRLEPDEMSHLKLPALLHWDLNHFVVLVSVTRDHCVVNDPALGRRRVGRRELSERFTGFAAEFSLSSSLSPAVERRVSGFLAMVKQVAGLRRAAAHLLILSFLLEVIELVTPMLSQAVIDEVLVTSDYDLLITIGMALFVLVVAKCLISVTRGFSVTDFGTTISIGWSTSLFEHLTALPIDYFSRRRVGDVVSRFNSLASIQSAVTTDVVQAVLDGVMALALGTMLYVYGGWLGALATLSVSLDLVFRMATYDTYRRASSGAFLQDAKNQSYLIETIQNITSMKLLNLGGHRQETWRRNISTLMTMRKQRQRYDVIFGRTADLIFGIDHLLLLSLGAYRVMGGHMSIGMLIAFLSYNDMFAARIGALITAGFKMRALSVQTERLSDIVMSEREQTMPVSRRFSDGTKVEDPRGAALSVESLSFRYSRFSNYIISSAEFFVEPGDIVSIVGPSGCGKTTILKILMGLLPPSDGHVLFNGVDIKSIGPDEYRKKISGLLQEDHLFSGSIRENISCFSERPDDALIEECARRADIWQDVNSMPLRFDTLTGDLGSSLSSGQKQRILLARAFYMRPSILFLDEPTSHLDENAESRVMDSIVSFNTTTIISAHRPATVARSNLIIHVTPGRIVTKRLRPDGKRVE